MRKPCHYRRAFQIQYCLSLCFGMFSVGLCYYSALHEQRWWLLVDVMVAAVNLQNALCAHQRLKQCRD